MPRSLTWRWYAAAGGLVLAVLLPPSAIQAGRTNPTTPARAQALPAGFEDTLVASVGQPTALTFSPDGRMLITTQRGRVRVYQDGSLKPTPALDLEALGVICQTSEQGVLGIAVDPTFAATNYVYLYYTSLQAGSCFNRVSRFVLPASNVIDPDSETILIDDIPATGGYHNGGDLEFGKDGLLYVSVGDGGCDYAGNSGCDGENDASRDLNVLLGKVLRITPGGGIPATNPFQGAGTARCNLTGQIAAGLRCQETFAWGFRNPFRFAFDPNAADTRFFVNDVGESNWEEIDSGTSGADYGWNVREGPCRRGTYTDCGPPPVGMTNPIFSYRHDSTGCGSITGGAFVTNGVWPAEYEGDYLFSDYVCGRIYRLERNGDTYETTEFASGLGGGSAVHMEFGSTGASQALYYTTYFDGGEVHRIAFTGDANRAPTAELTASPASGPVPLQVDFDGAGSGDPDAGDTLVYLWDFGDGSEVLETAGATISHTYTTPGTYTASLQVKDNHGALSLPDTVRIDPGNTAPVPTIAVPTPTQRFAVGEQVVLQGSAVDAQDGRLADSSLSWTVVRHHGTDHTHPWLTETVGNNVPMPASPSPEDVFSAGTSYLEVRLTATDSNGLSATTVREFRPRTVDLAFATVPAGLDLELFAADVTAPFLLPAWEGWQFGVSAARQTDSSGHTWIFDSWSDGGAAAHSITTGTTPAAYTASFHENRAPVASPFTVSATEDGARTVTLQATDADADALSYAVTRQPANGTVGAPTGDHVVYTPTPQFNGTDSLGFSATDGDASSTEASVALTVTEVNDPPAAMADSATTAEDTAVLIDVRANDSKGPANESSQTLTINSVDDPPHGSATIQSGKVRYAPDADYAGPDSFGYRVCDNGTTNGAPDPLCANGTIDVNVTPVNDPPVAVSDVAVTAEDSSVVVDLLANDLPGPPNESGQTLRVSAVGAPAHGSAVLLGSGLDAGKVRYTPAPDYNGPDAFSYQVCDDGTSNGAPDPKCAGSSVAFSFSVPRSPLNIALPQLTGGAIAGRSVRADSGRWGQGARDPEFQWLRCNLGGLRCALIPRATDASYLLRVPDIRRRLRVRVSVANRFGRSSALSASTPPIRSPIVFSRIVFHPPARSEHESIALRNVGADRVQLRGWTIGDGDGNLFRFRRFSLRKGQSVSVETGTGIATATRRVRPSVKQVWDDRGERAVLRTPNGALADSCRYRATRSGAARC